MPDTAPRFKDVDLRGWHFVSEQGKRCALSLRAGDGLLVVREADNPYDSNAIAVYREDTQVGYVAREIACAAASWMDKGFFYLCYVEEVTQCPFHYRHMWLVLDPIRPSEKGVEVKREEPLDAVS